MKLFSEALNNLLLHKTRSSLAILGIIFGVASVICMLSISEVARRDAVNRIERMGLKNVLLDSVKPQKVRAREKSSSDESFVANFGITRTDLDVLQKSLPEVEKVVPIRVLYQEVETPGDAGKANVNVAATTPDYGWVMEHGIDRGRFFSPKDESDASAVCVLGHDAARQLFPLLDPIGGVVRLGGLPFTVIGVLERKGQSNGSGILANPDNTAYIPFNSSFARFGELQYKITAGSFSATQVEVDRAVLRVSDSDFLRPVSNSARNVLEMRHKQNDLEVTIPYSLLEDHRRTENIFRWVMGSLAAISLLVGGIGIMNIMLANVAERRHEIGLRRALGATRANVIMLFVAESTLLCGLGGALGLAFGAGLAIFVGNLANWAVAFQAWAFPLGFGVSVVTGLVFGTLPAIKAAKLDPVLALRVE